MNKAKIEQDEDTAKKEMHDIEQEGEGQILRPEEPGQRPEMKPYEFVSGAPTTGSRAACHNKF